LSFSGGAKAPPVLYNPAVKTLQPLALLLLLAGCGQEIPNLDSPGKILPIVKARRKR
jgi:hypothetical protein